MILNVYRVIAKFAGTVIVYEYSQSKTRGKIVQSYATGTASMTAIPMTPQILKYLPPGAYTHKDMKFYATGAAVLTQRSVIQYNGNYYRVDKINDRADIGNFTEYMAKLIDAAEMQ